MIYISFRGSYLYNKMVHTIYAAVEYTDMLHTNLQVVHETIHFACSKHSEHGLTNVERVPPIVIADGSVILLDT